MSRGQLTAIIAALALGAVAPQLAAQDTSAAGRSRRDTSGYSGAAGVDTSARPARVGAIDSTGAGLDSTRTSGTVAPGRADADSTGPLGASDTSGMGGRHPDSTKAGDTANARTSRKRASDTATVAQPSKQPGQSTSRTGDSGSTTSP
jgi:hypothetical protein